MAIDIALSFTGYAKDSAPSMDDFTMKAQGCQNGFTMSDGPEYHVVILSGIKILVQHSNDRSSN